MGKQITISEIDAVLSFTVHDEPTRILLSARSPEATAGAVPQTASHESQYRVMFSCAATPEIKAGKAAGRGSPRSAK